MNLRFFQKKDGSKILQTRRGEADKWRDVPLVKEKYLLDRVIEAIYSFEAQRGEKPDGIIVGFEDYEVIIDEERKLRIIPDFGLKNVEVMGIPMTKHQNKPHGIFMLVEAR
jgi:hypothetical protein